MRCLVLASLLVTCAAEPRRAQRVRRAAVVSAGSASPAPATASFRTRVGVTGEDPLAVIAVFDATVAGGKLLVLESDRLSVTARDMASGAEIWRRPLAREAKHTALLQRLEGERVLLRTGDGLTTLDTATGNVVAAHDLELDDRIFMWRRDGACLLRGRCSAQLLGCADGAPLGAPLSGKFLHLDGPDDDGCLFDLELGGRSGDVAVYFTRSVEGFDGVTAIGVDTATGAERWRSSSIGCASYCPSVLVGMHEDLCWVGSEDLVAFGCQDGKERWRRPTRDLALTLWSDGALFAATAKQAMLLEPATGKARWQRTLAPEELALPVGAALPAHANIALRDDVARTLVWLDAAGAEVRRETLLADADAVAEGPPSDHTGQPVPGARAFEVERTSEPDRVILRVRGGRAVSRLEADAWSLGEVGAVVALMVAPGKDEREVWLFRAPETAP
jgi:hypothetical protein